MDEKEREKLAKQFENGISHMRTQVDGLSDEEVIKKVYDIFIGAMYSMTSIYTDREDRLKILCGELIDMCIKVKEEMNEK